MNASKMVHIVLIIYKAALNALYFSGLYRLLSPYTRGEGIIFTLHEVNNEPADDFSPNSILRVTPEFLEETIKTAQAEGYEFISLDELYERQKNGNKSGKPYAVLTADDGYKDNRDCALPILKKYNVPLAIYIVSDYSSHEGEMWWFALEDIIRENSSIKNPYNEGQVLEAITTEQKYRAFDTIYWPMRRDNQHEQRKTIRKMAEDYKYDLDALTKNLVMDWEELRELNKEPLITLAAHTKSHFAIARVSEEEGAEQIQIGMDKMEQELGERATHFSFPYGSNCAANSRDFENVKKFGFKTAVTTRKAVLYKEHKDHMMALPRVSLNGEYQSAHYIKTFLSGLPFRLKNKWQKLDVK